MLLLSDACRTRGANLLSWRANQANRNLSYCRVVMGGDGRVEWREWKGGDEVGVGGAGVDARPWDVMY